MKSQDIIEIVEQLAPPALAAEWDNSGWQVGTPAQEVTGALLALDPTMEVAKEAKRLGANLIIAHHPLFLRPLSRLDLDSHMGRLVRFLLVEEIGVYAAHTNWDVAAEGVSTALAEAIGLEKLRPLKLLPGLGSADAGWGRIGETRHEMSTADWVQRAKLALGAPQVRLSRGEQDPHRAIAVCGGSGSDLIGDVLASGASLYITGEMKYHQAQQAVQGGLTVIEVGHFYSERPAMRRLAERLAEKMEVHLSEVNSSPFG